MSHIRNTGFKGLNSYIDGDPDPDTNQVWPTCMSKNQEKCFLSAYHLSFSWTDRCHYFFLDFGQFNSFALELIPIRIRQNDGDPTGSGSTTLVLSS
jgi:hypothetical protein